MKKTIIPGMVLQSEANECGLACIAMLAETQGVDTSLEMLRKSYPASAHGMTMKQLCDVLQDLAIPHYPVKFDFSELEALPLPAILHYGEGHYVVLAYCRNGKLCVMNPALGQQLLPAQALKQAISGYAVVVAPAEAAEEKVREKAREKAATALKRRRRLAFMSLKETAGIRGIYRLMLITFLISLSLFIMPIMVSSAINDVYTSPTTSDFPYGLYLLVFVASSLLALGVRLISERFIKRFVVIASQNGFSRLLANSLNFFEKRAPGEIYSRFISWQGTHGQKIELDNGLRTHWVIVLIAFVIMAYISLPLALLSLGGITVMGLISVWAMARDRYYTQALEEYGAKQNDFIMESIQGYATIKSAGLMQQRNIAYAGHSATLFETARRKNIYETIKNTIYQLVSSLEMVFFMLLALPQLKDGSISLGAFFAYNFIRQIFASYVTTLFFAVLEKNRISIIDKRAADLFSAEAPPAAGSLPPVTPDTPLTYRDIGFHYEGEPQPVLAHLNLTVMPGECLAVVGESGCGKSTLLKIITGLLDPQQGTIEAGGQPLSAEHRNRLCFLQSQEDILFSGSMLENITLFTDVPPARRADIDAMLAWLNLQEVVAQLPGGLNALVRESHSGLSLGQRQRLLLARALYTTQPILMLDEPTANLDAATAHQVMAGIVDQCRRQGRTLIVVTHSAALCPLFDRTLLMEHGALAEQAAPVAMERAS
ncbi:peptidase domain-containing ABC transporter [Chimaeribacter arupi]|uniref:peptidase domain-containing ABC transporter n=1 Tax=Chimaeribacter arupi TaxID=2060066 RepID=UPI000C7AB193|nr:ATP-binding cassette domain-containing protein [Chimaeribacter arupi]PLR33557.1 ABC transporter ATP-binding protein [Chimaeribacter arupi]